MNIEKKAVNTLRALSIDMIQKASSGHPGLPMGAAAIAYTLFANHMCFNPKNDRWANRDRFVLSAGHGSALYYSLLHCFGFGLSLEEIKRFRQLKSQTPGHPEYGETKGVEVSTGPLGQGIANAVGMALAESKLAAEFNTDEFDIVDHYTYVLAGDGCLMEGVSSEASSFAAANRLNKLIILYDSNGITIEGETDIAFTENVRKRYEAYGFQTLYVEDGNDIFAIQQAIEQAKAEPNRPSFIEIKTKIGYGSPLMEGKAKVHGSPLGKEEILKTKRVYGVSEEDFYISEDVKNHFDAIAKEKEKEEERWNVLFQSYRNSHPELAKKWDEWHNQELNDKVFDVIPEDHLDLASRQSSEKVLNALEKNIPNLFGGSADLGPSNLSVMKDRSYYSHENKTGSNIHFGIREFAMTAIATGIALHGGLRPYIAGFLVFSDYMKSGLRMQALMNVPVISIFTHDSIGVGEDGPTHQPIEQLAMLRSIPNYTVIRPADLKETKAAWQAALQNQGPTALVFSRQKLISQQHTSSLALKGAYVVCEEQNPECILIASGSELNLAVSACEILKQKNKKIRVVSMPSFELFEKQTKDYQEKILPKSVRKRIAIEALSSFGWDRFVGLDGKILSLDQFGLSAPAEELFTEYHFTVDHLVHMTLQLLEEK